MEQVKLFVHFSNRTVEIGPMPKEEVERRIERLRSANQGVQLNIEEVPVDDV